MKVPIKNPQAFQIAQGRMCQRRPGATTLSRQHARFHPASSPLWSHSFSIQLRSAIHLPWIADLAPSIGSLLPVPGYSSSSSLEHFYSS